MRCFSAAIYQWRPPSNTRRCRFLLLSALFFKKNTVVGTIPRTTVLRNLTEAMRYATLGKSKQTWQNTRHQRILEQALPIKTISDGSSPYRRNELTVNELIHTPNTICKSQVWRSTYFRAKLACLMIAQAIRQLCVVTSVVVPIRSTWQRRTSVYISRYHGSSHVIITRVQTSCEELREGTQSQNVRI